MQAVITSINKANLLKAYQVADENGRQMLSALYGKDALISEYTDITDFETACAFTGDDPNDKKFKDGRDDENARRELEVITLAINGGVVLSNANIEQKKWRGWFEFTATGFRFDDAYDVSTTSDAGAGSRLAFLDEARQVHAAKYFLSYYERMQR